MSTMAYKDAAHVLASHAFLNQADRDVLVSGLVALPASSGGQFVPFDEYEAMKALCFNLKQRSGSRLSAPDPQILDHVLSRRGLSLDAAQRDAVVELLCRSVSVVTGGPGTGKSTIASIAIDYVRHTMPRATIACAAYSARAAAAIASKCRGTPYTLHSLLGLEPKNENGYAKRDLSDIDVVIVDEVFSADPGLILNILRVTRPDARVMLLGDPQQLPPVGYSRAMHDLLDLEAVAHVRLRTAHRLGGASHLAHQVTRMASGLAPHPGQGLDIISIKRNMRSRDAAVIAARLHRENISRGLSSLVLTPTQHGDAGHKAINKLILGRSEFLPGDPVITIGACPARRYRNGMTGVIDTLGNELIVVVDNLPVVIDDAVAAHLQHIHAMSAHRAQGLEYDRVILVLTHDMVGTASRQMMVSATTRAPHCTIIEERGCIAKAVYRDDVAIRPRIIHALREQSWT